MNVSKRWLLLIVLLVAVILRVWGIEYDLPFIYHPDEPRYITYSQHIFKTSDLNPHFFNYPSLFFYINSLAYIPYYVVGRLLGIFNTPSDILYPVSLAMGVTRAPMPTVVLLGRMVTLLFSIGSVLLAFLVGELLTGNMKVGLLTSLMMAVSPTLVWHGRLITPDTFVTFFVLVVFWASILILQRGKTWHYVTGGISIGLAASTKYNGGLVGLLPVMAHFLRWGKDGFKDWRLYLLPLLSGLGFLLTTPYAILDYTTFITDLKFEMEHYSTGHFGMEGNSLQWYAVFLWKTTGPLSILAVLEVLRGIYTRSKHILLLASFPVVYFIFINRFVVRNDRSAMPMLPFLFLLAASWLVANINRCKALPSRPTRSVLCVGLLILTVASLVIPTTRTVRTNFQLTSVTSLEIAREWIADNLPAGATIAIESYAPFVDPERFSVQGFLLIVAHPPDWYVSQGFEYLIFSQGMFGRFYAEPDKYADQVSRYNEFFERFTLVKKFDEGGYEIRIYRVDENVNATLNTP